MTYTNALLLSAIFEANAKCEDWWNDDHANRLIFDAVLIGWIRRPSTSQIEWTEAGAELCRVVLGL